ncbi:HNH endonuclease [Pseudomonas sp. Tul1A2]
MFNVSRPTEAPPSLARRTKYDGEDVYEAISTIFHDKCYLCETKEPQDINVEHFRAHLNDEDKKYSWDNLYFACSRCNNIKGDRYNNLLDCCDPQQNVLRAIKHLPPNTPYAKTVQIISTLNSESAHSTKDLLEKIYNSEHTVNKKVSGSFLRRKIFDQYNLLLTQINNYYNPIATAVEKNDALERLKILIRRDQPYSAFMAWCILEDDELSLALEAFIDQQ